MGGLLQLHLRRAGALGVELKVAATMGKGIVEFGMLRAQGRSSSPSFAALMGAIVWNLLTWVWGCRPRPPIALAGA